MNTIIAPRRNGSRVHGLAAAGGVLLGLASSGLAAQASTIALDPLATAVYTTEYHARAGGGVALDQETTHSGSSSSTHQSITSIGSVGSANFDLGVIAKPLPGVTVSVASSGSAYASASGEVTYQFRIETLSGLPNQIVPVTISFKGDQSVSPVNANLYNQTDASVSIEGDGYKESYSVEGGHYPGASH